MRQLEVIVGVFRQGRNRDVAFQTIAFAVFVMVDGGLGLGRVAIPGLDLGEKLHQVARSAQLVAHRPEQDAGGQGAHQAHHLDVLADRWRLVHRAQDTHLFQGAQVGIDPAFRIGSQITQGDRSALFGQRAGVGCAGGNARVQVGIAEDRGPQLERLGGLVGDELLARHGRGGAHDVEAVRNEGDDAFVRQAFFRVGLLPQVPVGRQRGLHGGWATS